jgi:hypothetical protein
MKLRGIVYMILLFLLVKCSDKNIETMNYKKDMKNVNPNDLFTECAICYEEFSQDPAHPKVKIQFTLKDDRSLYRRLFFPLKDKNESDTSHELHSKMWCRSCIEQIKVCPFCYKEINKSSVVFTDVPTKNNSIGILKILCKIHNTVMAICSGPARGPILLNLHFMIPEKNR